MPEDVTAYGATPDDPMDDTEAFIEATKAAAGGTVSIPEGTFIINSKRHRGGGALHLDSTDTAGTSYVGAGPDKTTVKMAGDHEYNHIAFKYVSDLDHDGAEIRDMTLDGNQWNQTSNDGSPPNGFAIVVQGSSQDVLVENCRVKDWATTGGLYQAKGVTVRHCSFLNCGAMVWERGGWRGHGFNVGNDASSIDKEGLLCEYCYFTGSSGTSIDNNGGSFTMRRCYSEDQQFALKFNDGTRTTVENCRWTNLSHRGIYTTTDDNFPGGRLELRDVALEEVGYEAIATRLSGDVTGDNIHVVDANTENFHNGEAIRLEDKSVSLGTICVTDTQGGGVFDVTNSSGSINELIHKNNSDGVGSIGDISIENETNGGSFSVNAPTASDVGVNSSDKETTTSYDHTLKVEAASGADLTYYTIEVTGEAVVGPNSNIQESVTQLSNGNYLIEGQVATGGTDDFKFNGEVVAKNSSIDGNATAYVDGSEVSLTSTSRTYDHLLEIKAATGADLTEYTVEVTGEAVVGPNSNIQESVTELSSGNYLIEGQVATGGTDDFKFNGEVVAENSSIDGNAAAYVDGSQVDFSPDGSSDDSGSDAGFGSYTLPDPGSADWHQPLNDNFDQLGQDVQALNDRLNELENQIN